MRFLADENVPRIVIERLRTQGFEVASISELQPGATDKDVLEIANTGNSILITEDRDFGEMVIRQRLGVRGVMLLELDRLSNAAQADVMVQAVSLHGDKLSGNLAVIEPERIRIRPLSR
jgi:predicted nuclease of predicted toxin-antitoxin system